MMKKLFIFTTFIILSSACLITNCPRGGKRGDIVPLEGFTRECFGPHICCGSTIGCFIGTSETYTCRKESLYTHPCIAGYAMCRENTGRCAASGICCSQESCFMDSNCRLLDNMENDRKIDSDLNAVFGEIEISNKVAQ
ncbi:oxytocin-neurophysin 1-like isoform X2 [Vespa mandarinia]|uniref:oxytocin-neurophysin 1-like isoform X2 n=1 Tax=Vespa mandarinia TaxID=7446 RepID=UPI00161B6509|nr:oxytocin-neurophysin 1-like isoform X2 [Vespa mandarinia]